MSLPRWSNCPAALILCFVLFVVAGPAALAQCHFASSGGGRVVTYTFEPDLANGAPVLHATVTFQGSASGTEQIEVPTQWAGEHLNAVRNLRALSPETTIEDGARPYERIIRYKPDSEVTLAYDLVKDWSGPLVHPMQFHPVVMPEYFEINGENALVHPEIDRSAQVIANFDFHKLPASWALATSFGTSTEANGRCQFFSGSWIAVAEALFAAGDFRIRRFAIGRQPAVLAVRGEWKFTDEDAIGDIQKVVGLVRDFWHDDNFPYFLVTLKPYDQDHGSSDGSAFTNAFWMYVSRLDSISGLLPQLAHETFHAWNPRKMGTYGNGEETKSTWFHEGFTQYYGFLLVYRAGLMDLPAYVESVNSDLRKYPNTNDPYVRGRAIALWLDGEIRKESGGKKTLDNMMYDMVGDAAKPLTLSRVFETAGRYIDADSRGQLERAVAEGIDLPLPADAALGGCAAVSLSKVEVPSADLGFDVNTTRSTRKVTGVREDGPAYKAGLRNGQDVRGISYHANDPKQVAKISIQAEGGVTLIQYYPATATIVVPQYHTDSTAAAGKRPACLGN
ncbi:MAG TPA: hypothetical protein VFO34_00535 [Candidatus Acidoferrales bacterium]|nr:hypothetical protein [Candidatus Acidoferrales bacterium]